MTDTEDRKLCECGEPLVEDADGRLVTIGDLTFPFSRSTDYVLCQTCGNQVPADRLHPDREPATQQLHALATEAEREDQDRDF
ncbi:MAG: hypothetical protein R3320_05300 [Nitriliruptorales bacterium]|nr:hypothetical protein [Nitriliruptorales bacterium]